MVLSIRWMRAGQKRLLTGFSDQYRRYLSVPNQTGRISGPLPRRVRHLRGLLLKNNTTICLNEKTYKEVNDTEVCLSG